MAEGTEGQTRSSAEQGLADQIQGDAPGGGARVDDATARKVVREYAKLRFLIPKPGAGGAGEPAGIELDSKEEAKVQKMFTDAKEQYLNGSPELMLFMLVPKQDEAGTDAAMFALENTIKNNNLSNPSVRQEIIDKWVESETPLNAAAFFVEYAIEDGAIKDQMQKEVSEKLQPMSEQERRQAYDQKVSEATEALKHVPEEQREYYRGKLAKLSIKFGDFFNADTTSGQTLRIIGKIGWYALWISFCALIFEMNLIGKIPSGKR